MCFLSFAQGIYDVVSSDDLKGLTADDLQLLFSGKAEPVSCEQLRSISTFEDARGNALRSAEPEQLARFESLFWETVKSMDESERLKLVGMATGSLVRTRVVGNQYRPYIYLQQRMAATLLRWAWSVLVWWTGGPTEADDQTNGMHQLCPGCLCTSTPLWLIAG